MEKNECILLLQSLQLFVSFMRQARQQRLNYNKENDGPNATNLPSLKNPYTKFSKENQYHLNLKDRKKTFLNLYSKKDESLKLNFNKDTCHSKNSIETSRLFSENSNVLSSRGHGTFMSSRPHLNRQKPQRTQKKTLRTPIKTSDPQILKKHQITGKMRAKMVDWLLEIVQAYNCCQETFFLAVFIMDIYFQNSQKPLSVSELHLIGVTSIFMAAKYEQVHPITLKTVHRDIGHGKIEKKQIIQQEAQILNALNFSFGRDCPYLTAQQILYDFTQTCYKSNSLKNRVNYYLKLATFDSDFLRAESGVHLAKGAILAAIRSAQLESCAQNLDSYDNFISACGRDYEKSHIISSQLMLLQANLKTRFGFLQNIDKISPGPHGMSKAPLLAPMVQSCAL